MQHFLFLLHRTNLGSNRICGPSSIPRDSCTTNQDAAASANHGGDPFQCDVPAEPRLPAEPHVPSADAAVHVATAAVPAAA